MSFLQLSSFLATRHLLQPIVISCNPSFLQLLFLSTIVISCNPSSFLATHRHFLQPVISLQLSSFLSTIVISFNHRHFLQPVIFATIVSFNHRHFLQPIVIFVTRHLFATIVISLQLSSFLSTIVISFNHRHFLQPVISCNPSSFLATRHLSAHHHFISCDPIVISCNPSSLATRHLAVAGYCNLHWPLPCCRIIYRKHLLTPHPTTVFFPS